jgi:hypothetical protein
MRASFNLVKHFANRNTIYQPRVSEPQNFLHLEHLQNPVQSGMTTEPNNSPILEGATLEQARQRETLKVVSAILGLIVSIVVFVIWVPGGASTALRGS